MKLTIKDYGYGIDRRSGQKVESLVATYVFDSIKSGDILSLSEGARPNFMVLEASEEKVSIKVNQKGFVVEIAKGKEEKYQPLTRDGGHYYIFILE